MGHATYIGRLGMLAAGLSIGAALACTPGVASADSSPFGLTPTELADVDQILRALFDPTGADMQVSINGMELFPTDGNTAMATSGTGDIAIAVGDGSSAVSAGPAFPFGIPLGSGIGDIAFANGTNSTADAGLIGSANFDFVYANGANSFANAGLAANFDIASAVGTGSKAETAIGDSFDISSANGTNSSANIGVLGNYDLTFANGTDSTANAGVGNYDLATALNGGNASAEGIFTNAFADGVNSAATASGGLFNTAFASGGNAEANAVLGWDNFAAVLNTGSALDVATAGGNGNLFANNDIAEIIGTGSTATAGSDLTTAGNFDLAAAFGDILHAIATGGNFLWDIPPLPLL